MWHIANLDAVQYPVFLVRAEPDRGLLRVFGELDIASARDLLLAATEHLYHCQSITVDLAELVFVDAAGLGALTTLRNRCHASGTNLEIVGASARVARVFELAGLVDMLIPAVLAAVTQRGTR